MAHLREGSVVNYSTIQNATVTNLTDQYFELEYVDPATSETVVIVRSWATQAGIITVVTD